MFAHARARCRFAVVVVSLAIGLCPSATRATPADETEIYVAAADLPIGTKLDRDNLAKFVTRKKVAKANLPEAFVTDAEKLADCRTTRAIRKGDAISPKELTRVLVQLPEGKDLLTIPGNTTGVAGFIGPGSRIDVIASGRKDGKVVAFTLLEDSLVVAVEVPAVVGEKAPEKALFSLAVDKQEALLVAAAEGLKLELNLVLRNPTAKAGDAEAHIKQVKKTLAEWAAKPATAPTPQTKP